MPDVAVGVPSLGNPSWVFVESLMRLRAPGGAYHLLRAGPLAIDVARNELVRQFLRTDCRWLLMVDSDAQFDPATLTRLLSWGEPLVGALAFARYGPLMPTLYRDRDPEREGSWRIRTDVVDAWLARYPEMVSSTGHVLEPRPFDALEPVDRSGCHCVLIRRDVLETMPAPWFVGDPEQRHNKEDIFFFEQAAAAGFQAYVDKSCMTGHLYGDRPLAALDYVAWQRADVFRPAGWHGQETGYSDG